MKVQKYLRKFKITQGYKDWFARFARINAAYNAGYIKSEQLVGFQLFLLQTGQFNANFTLEELNRLKYPKSPFAMMHQHGYLRCVYSWAMEVLNVLYREDKKLSENLYPVWVDSSLIWSELERYCKVEVIDNYEIHPALISLLNVEFQSNYRKLRTPRWLCVSKPEHLSVAEHVREIQEKIIKKHKKTFSNFKNQIVVCFKDDSFESVNAIVIFNRVGDNVPEFVSETIDHLGYRIDPVCALRILLRKVPLLFVDAKQTKLLWEKLLNTLMVQGLNYSEQLKIERLGRAVVAVINTRKKFSGELTTIESFIFERYLFDLTKTDYAAVDWGIYSEYIKVYLDFYKNNNKKNLVLRYVVDREIKSVIWNFIDADVKVPLKIRWVQVLAEIMNLDFENKKFKKSFSEIVEQKYLQGLPVQKIMVTPYAMRAFVRVFQILGDIPQGSKIFVTNQSYYELLTNLENISKNETRVFMVQTLVEITDEADILFLEFHPNNVVASQQFDHDVMGLLGRMQAWKKKQRTLVIDITLNMLNDDEIREFLDNANQFIKDGSLNVILIQSLTKFAQLGLDQRSGGLIVVINNSHFWQLTENIAKLEKAEIVDSSIRKFFNFFISYPKLLLKYIESIKKNCYEAYVETLQKINELDIPQTDRCQLIVSSDRGACYIGLNLKGLLLEADTQFQRSHYFYIEYFLEDMLEYLFFPICDFLELPLTERLSIGFPLSSIDITLSALRLTIGLESRDQLEQYAEIIVYIIFLINMQSNVQIFFDNNDLRRAFFKEKTEQFKSTVLRKGYRYSFKYQIDGREFYLNISDCNISAMTSIGQYAWGSYDIFMRTERGNEPLSKTCSYPDGQRRRMVIASLSAIPEFQNIRCYISDSDRAIIIPSLFARQHYFYLYGPYSTSVGSAFFGFGSSHEGKGLYFFPLWSKAMWLNPTSLTMFFPDRFSLVKKGNVFIAIYDMPFGDIAYLIREGAYTLDTSSSSNFNYNGSDSKQYIECTGRYNSQGNMQFYYSKGRVIIEHDFICYRNNGITIYKRNLGNTYTAVEIDYWIEKDPAIARFLSLMIAIFVKDQYNVSFIARNFHFCHFLFDMSYEAVNEPLRIAAERVMQHQVALTGILGNNSESSTVRYSFFVSSNSNLQWPSGRTGIDYVENKELIDKSIAILKPGAH